MQPIPADKHCYKTTPEFDQDSIPLGLTRHHTTKAGTWARIHVISGRLVLQFIAEGDWEREEYLLTPDHFGTIEPQRPHQVRADGPVTFFVEFYR